MKHLVDKLYNTSNLSNDELKILIENITDEDMEHLRKKARQKADEIYGKQVFVRGLIEFTNYCKNDCYYCGIRASNKCAERYRLNKEDILNCCEQGHTLGFRTFVLQGGEDLHYSDDEMCNIISSVKSAYPDCALTLSVGERSYDTYKRWFDCGADRYLLRHETADKEHYQKLHPEKMSFDNRMKCLENLKEIGYQTGCGFMVGSPYQTTECLIKDLRFIKEFQPAMVGIGPYLSHKETPFANEKNGEVRLTLILLSIIRLLLPEVLLPATTALGTAAGDGRERGILAGANVVMPNLSPVKVRKKYSLYDNKICTGEEAAECKFCLTNRVKSIGYEIVSSRGDNIKFIRE
ncbi:MAG: [FeFe] hydrogenase H-cluster radical SAM maturase HydE [Acutalibacteraceae bacterium]|nr:[FeFe] hydrogenase H-cluster radical SAM maturase HydE [Acutalibacteraceae bacterium]